VLGTGVLERVIQVTAQQIFVQDVVRHNQAVDVCIIICRNSAGLPWYPSNQLQHLRMIFNLLRYPSPWILIWLLFIQSGDEDKRLIGSRRRDSGS
jgi:hypothetical protein